MAGIVRSIARRGRWIEGEGEEGDLPVATTGYKVGWSTVAAGQVSSPRAKVKGHSPEANDIFAGWVG